MTDPASKTLKLKKPIASAARQKGSKTDQKARKKHGMEPTHACARQAAFISLKGILGKNLPADIALAENKMLAALQKRDRAFARLLLTSCLRRYGQNQKIIDHCLSKPAEADVNLVLHIGLTQLLFVGTHAHAAVNTSVDLARILGLDRAVGLVNAVLRRISHEQESLLGMTSVLDNLPTGIKTRWMQVYGLEQTTAIMTILMTTPPLDLTFKPEADLAELVQSLHGLHLQDHTLRCHFDGDIRQMPFYEDGLWWVQDAASALCGKLTGPTPDKIIWDLCAAPGGKTAQLAAADAKVTAVDVDAQRLGRLNENLERLGLSATVMQADILSVDFDQWAASCARPDVILLDAPCSATGTIRRRPDILIRRNRLDLKDMQTKQRAMLAAALRWVSPQGFVIYATCSLQPEEGEDVVQAMIDEKRAKLEAFSTTELGRFAPALSAQGWARILPTCLSDENLPPQNDGPACKAGNDGFFIARLRPEAA